MAFSISTSTLLSENRIHRDHVSVLVVSSGHFRFLLLQTFRRQTPQLRQNRKTKTFQTSLFPHETRITSSLWFLDLFALRSLPEPVDYLFRKRLPKDIQQEPPDWKHHRDCLLFVRWCVWAVHDSKKTLCDLVNTFAVFVSLLSIHRSSDGSIVAMKCSACLLCDSVDIDLMERHVTNSKTISAHGHTLNSILSRYCLISVILLSGPGVDTLIGVCNCHEM